MDSFVSVRLLLFLASLIVFGVSILLIQKNSHSRRGGDDFVRRKKLKTFGTILLFPAVVLLLLAALNDEMSQETIPPIDPAAAAAAQAYVPPVLHVPTESLLTPKDTWKTRMPSTNGTPYESASAQLTPSSAAPFSISPLTAPTPQAVPAPTPAPHSLSPTEQMQSDLATAAERIATNPKDERAYSDRANLYALKRDWISAEHDYRSALAINPDDTKVKFNLAEMAFLQKKYDVAKTSFAALTQDSDLGDLAAYKAFLSDLYGGQMDAAAKELDAFNQVAENASYYFANVAWAVNHRKLDDAREWLRSAMHIYPPQKFKLYATTLYEMGYLPLPPPPAPAN